MDPSTTITSIENHLDHCVPHEGGAELPLEENREIPLHRSGVQGLIAKKIMMMDDVIAMVRNKTSWFELLLMF